MKKHGFLWWLFIGWWWVFITLPFRILGAFIRWCGKYAEGANARTAELAEKKRHLEAKRDALLGARQGRNTEESGPKKETHKVAGVSYHQDEIKSLGTKNPDYSKTRQAIQDAGQLGKWISEYKFSPRQVELIPEPDNPYSENGTAIKVVVDGVHIGYVDNESSQHVNDLLDDDRIAKISCSINGGNKKRYVLDGEDDYVLEHDDFLFWARLTITVK